MNNKDKKRELKKKRKLGWKKERQIEQRFSRFPLNMVQQSDRACGECQGCCMAVGVHELEKPVWTECKHQCLSGCAIYNDRPKSCQTYNCLWQGGMLKGEENRPDKIGMIFEMRGVGNSGVDAISAWEIKEGAADDPKVMAIVEQISKFFVVYVRRYKSSKRRIAGPEQALRNLKVFDIANSEKIEIFERSDCSAQAELERNLFQGQLI